MAIAGPETFIKGQGLVSTLKLHLPEPSPNPALPLLWPLNGPDVDLLRSLPPFQLLTLNKAR